VVVIGRSRKSTDAIGPLAARSALSKQAWSYVARRLPSSSEGMVPRQVFQ
jgi:hypothetical protein